MIRWMGAVGLLACASLAWPQRPSDEEAAAIIERGRQHAAEYVKSLPDFTCLEIVQRYSDPRQRGAWMLNDKLTVKLSYTHKAEEHQLLLVDGHATDKTYDMVGGATSVGEFGGVVASLFDRISQAEFRWQAWKNVRKRRAAVFEYTVMREHSNYLLATGTLGSPHKDIVGYHGEMDVDPDTGEVLHFTYIGDHIPKGLAVDHTRSEVNYDFAEIAGRTYLLPSHSETEMNGPKISVRNVMEFHDYQKFSAESNITFDPGK